MNSAEQQLRAQLGIPPTATRVLIMEQSAHCDWDWMSTFQTYYQSGGGGHQAVETTLNQAIASMQADQAAGSGPYRYTFCEMAYLRQFLQDHPGQIAALDALGQRFNISSGGITSADNLLSHGEAFIRNYLVGRQWLGSILTTPASNQLWIPDDFGHDPQLPIVLQAMGFMGAGFWRIPAQVGAPAVDCVQPVGTAPSSILAQQIGLDFTWQAADGSAIQAHWLSNSYCEGNCACQGSTSTACFNIDAQNTIKWNGNAQQAINGLIQQQLYTNNGTPIPQPTPYLFVPVDCDFTAPYRNLPEIIAAWNSCNGWNGGTSDCPAGTNPSDTAGLFVVLATFDDFMQLVQAHTAPESGNSPLAIYAANPADPAAPAFTPHPYYSGCYGSKPVLKALHYQTTRTLLLAEALELLLEYLAAGDPGSWSAAAAAARSDIAAAWDTMLPSTHHDYITGTAPDDVYFSEQLPLLHDQALPAALSTCASTLSTIANALPPGPADMLSIAVFNGLGVARSGLVQVVIPATSQTFTSATSDGASYTPIDDLGDGTILCLAATPSLGYQTVRLTTTPPNVTPTLALEAQPDGSYILANACLSATIAGSGIVALYDLSSDPHRTSNLVQGIGNEVVCYQDSGNIYRFGNELPCSDSIFCADSNLQLQHPTIMVTEDGALRKTITISADLSPADGESIQFTSAYTLLPDEPFLRMETTGAAPSGYSVMVRFPFAAAIQTLTYGTAHHWDTRAPREFFDWQPDPAQIELMTFEPTHEFVIPVDSAGSYLGAIYHAGTPGWAIDAAGRLLGCVLRNTPGTQNAASGTDSSTCTASYALRIPGSGALQLQPPTRGAAPGGPLGETLQLSNPLVGMIVPDTASGTLPATMSIAATADPTAIITAAKAGTINESDLILRIYQPQNTPLPGIEVTLDAALASLYQRDGVVNVVPQTALETALAAGSAPLDIQAAASAFSFTAPYALTTVALQRGS